jgi:AcrR family transcriptional regulator
VPRLWSDTIDEHRQQVQQAVIDATARLVATDGPLAITMSRVAAESGIGRATLYKYFPDLGSIVLAWHDQQIAEHVARLAGAGDTAEPAAERLQAVLSTYATILSESHGPHGSELSALLHHSDHVARAEAELHAMVADLIAEAADGGDLRTDVPPAELATFALNALGGARETSSTAARRRLVALCLDALR